MGLAGSLKHEERGKVGQEIRVDHNSSEEVNKLDETSSNGRFATNARDGIWMIATIHEDAIIVEELAI